MSKTEQKFVLSNSKCLNVSKYVEGQTIIFFQKLNLVYVCPFY